MRISITGGAGYIGSALTKSLLEGGHEVVVLDRLLHGQRAVVDALTGLGAKVFVGDITDSATLTSAVQGADAVVHLAAIVGDPACARDPAQAHATNVDGSRAVVEAAVTSGVARFVFASTCSNYGRMDDPSVPVDESGELRPVSLYAEQKVGIEEMLLGGAAGEVAVTCLRFATVYGVSARMRFDLTVNEFTRDLWADRALEVFGEQFWRPYIHVRDAAAAVRLVLESPVESVAGQVFNAGTTSENYRKVDLCELIQPRAGRGQVSYVSRHEDPRDYKVSFERIKNELGFEPRMTVPEGIDEVLHALDAEAFGDPFDASYKN